MYFVVLIFVLDSFFLTDSFLLIDIRWYSLFFDRLRSRQAKTVLKRWLYHTEVYQCKHKHRKDRKVSFPLCDLFCCFSFRRILKCQRRVFRVPAHFLFC
jgi:hypothetical protein